MVGSQIRTLNLFIVFKKMNVRYYDPFRLTEPLCRWHIIMSKIPYLLSSNYLFKHIFIYPFKQVCIMYIYIYWVRIDKNSNSLEKHVKTRKNHAFLSSNRQIFELDEYSNRVRIDKQRNSLSEFEYPCPFIYIIHTH